MAYRYTENPRDLTKSYKTHADAYQNVDDLANRVAADPFFFDYPSKLRECTSVSAIIHHLINGDVTLQEIKDGLERREKYRNEQNESEADDESN